MNNDGSPLFSALAHFLSIGPDKYRKDIDLAVSQASCSYEAAVRALRKNDYDIVNAIMALTINLAVVQTLTTSLYFLLNLSKCVFFFPA